MLYPRDPSLDPQLVWKGKDEQDASRLEVPAVPIYIQEKIHPQAIIEDLRAHRGEPADEPELDLFADFNGLDDFDQKRRVLPARPALDEPADPRRLLLVMASLAEKERLQRPGADDLLRPALRHQVRLELAGQHPQARREGRQGRGR